MAAGSQTKTHSTSNYYLTNCYLWSNLQNVFTPNDFFTCPRSRQPPLGVLRLVQTLHRMPGSESRVQSAECTAVKIASQAFHILQCHCNDQKLPWILVSAGKKGESKTVTGVQRGLFAMPTNVYNFIEQLIKCGKTFCHSHLHPQTQTPTQTHLQPFRMTLPTAADDDALQCACKYATQY